MEATLEMENLGKRSGATHANSANRAAETEERISGIENTLEDIDTIVQKSTNSKKLLA